MKLKAYSKIGNQPTFLAFSLIFIGTLFTFSSSILLHQTNYIKDEIAISSKRHKHLQEKNAKLDEASLPSLEDINNILRRVKDAHKLSSLTSKQLLESISVIEQNTPADVSISRFNYRKDTSFIEIVSEAANKMQLNIFLEKLEALPFFKQVLLKKQGKYKSNNDDLEQYTIHLYMIQEHSK